MYEFPKKLHRGTMMRAKDELSRKSHDVCDERRSVRGVPGPLHSLRRSRLKSCGKQVVLKPNRVVLTHLFCNRQCMFVIADLTMG